MSGREGTSEPVESYTCELADVVLEPGQLIEGDVRVRGHSPEHQRAVPGDSSEWRQRPAAVSAPESDPMHAVTQAISSEAPIKGERRREERSSGDRAAPPTVSGSAPQPPAA